MCTAGKTPFKPFAELGLADYRSGLEDKLLGQVERFGKASRTCDPGAASPWSAACWRESIGTGTVASTVNGGVEAFVRAARP